MLLGIPGILSGDLLKVLSDMGHGDEVAIVDANFPAERRARRLVRDMGSSSVDMLAAVLGVMPLDHLGGAPARLMAVAEGDDCPEPTVWGLYSRCLDAAGCREEQFECSTAMPSTRPPRAPTRWSRRARPPCTATSS